LIRCKKKKKKKKKERKRVVQSFGGWISRPVVDRSTQFFLYAFLDIMSHLLFGGDFGMNPFLCVNLEL
jgi:hypothetical protein